jgi:hypothetical protein
MCRSEVYLSYCVTSRPLEDIPYSLRFDVGLSGIGMWLAGRRCEFWFSMFRLEQQDVISLLMRCRDWILSVNPWTMIWQVKGRKGLVTPYKGLSRC